jgi:hypothetical protein
MPEGADMLNNLEIAAHAGTLAEILSDAAQADGCHLGPTDAELSSKAVYLKAELEKVFTAPTIDTTLAQILEETAQEDGCHVGPTDAETIAGALSLMAELAKVFAAPLLSVLPA